jgi:hypothetical protein
VVRLLGDVLNNPWEYVRIDKIESVLTVQYTRDIWRLRGVELLDPVIDAGEKARIRLRLVPFVGPAVERVVDVRIPQELAGKDVDVEIVPGYDATTFPEVPSPDTLPMLLQNWSKQTQNPKSVVLQFRVPGVGVTYKGFVAPRMPHFALDALRPAQSDIAPEQYPTFSRTLVPMDRYIEGRDRVRIKVRPLVR